MHRKQAWSHRVRKERFKKKYVTRMQATRMLQTDSMGFRRLCILKGIYPRAIGQSKQKLSGNEKQYYLTKEIKWLVRDAIQEKTQAFQAWEKRVRRAKAMQLTEDLKLLQSKKAKPQYQLAATIKERYPFFVDAVKDIDDAMSMISLYAFLSPEIKSETTVDFHKALPSGLHEKAKEVVRDWLSFVERAQVLTRGFISIKGYYYEAIVKDVRVRWLMPHEYASKFPKGIQQYILITFLEFYVELMRFILFKLNNDLQKEIEEQELAESLKEEGVEPAAETFAPGALESGNKKKSESKHELMMRELGRVRNIFKDFTFYLSREIPQKHMRFVIGACGGRVVENYGPGVTHYVVDRPTLASPHTMDSNVEYVQPQYLFDCLNARVVLPVAGYRIGETLPPHVSPFTVAISNLPEDVNAVEEVKKLHPKVIGYIPKRVHEIRSYLDPTYSAIDAEGKIDEADLEYSDDEGHVALPRMDGDDEVSLSGSDIEEATHEKEWEDETVKENVERSKMSELQVKKQRELNLMNRPTPEGVAMRRQQSARIEEERRKSETREARLKRKLFEKEKEEKTRRKMQLQVARKKAARYFKMINGAIVKNEQKEKILGLKAKQLETGKTVAEADKIVSKNKSNQKKQKVANPYKKLPKWVQ